MKRITELLKKMNESEKYEGRHHSIEIYSDGSGKINSNQYDNVYCFGSSFEMTIVLNKLDAELSPSTENNWVL